MMQRLISAPRPAGVLGKAVLRAARAMDLTQQDLAEILGISPASVTRLARGRPIDPESKEGELAALFLRLFRSLDGVLGGDEPNMKRWMQAENLHVGGTPARLVRTVTGLVHVVEYLDAMRGKV